MKPRANSMRPWSSLLLAAAWLAASLDLSAEAGDQGGAPPQPHGPVPSARQLRWHELEMYGFIHFGINTFTDREWGYGDESPALFAPTDFDADQIVGALKAGGLKGVILTAKHHDGFCLWPSKSTEHSVKHSPWKGGKGDVVREISDACRRHGLEFGVYLSPWDRNHPEYGQAGYVAYYRNQLRELLTQYGPIFEVWFDGANGGDGYYGGARTTRKIDGKTYYGWEKTWDLVRQLQPDACIFSDIGPDVRWVGNESGVAGDPCWSTFCPENHSLGGTPGAILNRGERPGTHWLPAEVDVSIRPGWFYHAKADGSVMTVDRLVKLYFESVGRGCNLILNVPPDRRGRVHETDARALADWRRRLDALFATDLARGAKMVSGDTRAGDSRFAPDRLVDGDRETYWSTDDGNCTPQVVLELPDDTEFDVVRIREYLPLGQRVEQFAVDAWDGRDWRELARATSIGQQRVLRTPRVKASRVRLRILRSPVCPALSEFSLFASPRT
ncbi:MAG: alpha-L-fucosidase [Isosphaeraceae bacterium]